MIQCTVIFSWNVLVRVWFLNHFNVVVYHFAWQKKNVLLKENKRNRIRTAKGTGNGWKHEKDNNTTPTTATKTI